MKGGSDGARDLPPEMRQPNLSSFYPKPLPTTRLGCLVSSTLPASVRTRCQRRDLSGYRQGAEQIFYSAGVRVVKPYLLCLLQADKLWASGVTSIPHWLPSEAGYERLLRGDSSGANKDDAAGPRLERDIDSQDCLQL